MKFFFFLIFFSLTAKAQVFSRMNQTLEAYDSSLIRDCTDLKFKESDHGLQTNLSCRFTCVGEASQVKTISENFIPTHEGLFPGNGSSKDNTIWSSLTIALKNFTLRTCLELAHEECADGVVESQMEKLSSGEWEITRFPECKEKGVMISPFDTNSKSKRLLGLPAKMMGKTTRPEVSGYDVHFKNLKFNIPLGSEENKTCEHKISADICYGDCIDLESKDFVETLGTASPLGSESISICGDDFTKGTKDLNLSRGVLKNLCEEYFWKSIMKGNSMMKSCAALRGTVYCEKFLEEIK